MSEQAPPVLLLVGGDRERIGTMQQALDRRFGADYRVLTETAPERALSALAQLRDRDEQVAVLVADLALPGMTGEEFLRRAHELHPFARRALAAPIFDRPAEQAIFRAMALGRVDMILVRPWDPAEHWLYPRIGMMLDEWVQETQPSGVNAMRIVAEPGAPRSHALHDLLYRNAVPFQTFSPSSPEGRRLLDTAGRDEQRLPVCVYFDGRVQADPSVPQIAEMLGFHSRPQADHYDMIVIGAGPAGLSAALSGASEGLRTLLVEPQTVGGQAGATSLIRNFLGFPFGVSGKMLTILARGQALLFGAELVFDRAVGLHTPGRQHLVTLACGSEVTGDAVVLSMGVRYRRLDAPGVEDLLGAGVFYGAALCEAPAARGQSIYIVGAGNSAGQAAVHLARFAEHVTLLTRGKSLSTSMSTYLIEQISARPNITVRANMQVVGAAGAGRLEQLTLYDAAVRRTEAVAASALFILIGSQPTTDWLPAALMRDPAGFLLTGPDLVAYRQLSTSWPLTRPPLPMETSVPGVFAAGDTRHGSTKRVAAAVGEGVAAVQFAHRHFEDLAEQRPARR
ncbi:FAD-dependent oxidoreductase [Dactylosporangium sp. NPDC049140]|uniref:FAD-dependent oxidoreductase n=1 Tax=Dactylosporangium sp. NPDC049140 TaxID=3155647 RepID=UPI0033EAC24A